MENKIYKTIQFIGRGITAIFVLYAVYIAFHESEFYRKLFSYYGLLNILYLIYIAFRNTYVKKNSLDEDVDIDYYYLMINDKNNETFIYNQKQHYEWIESIYKQRKGIEVYHEEKDIEKMKTFAHLFSKTNNYNFNENYTSN